jgi:hypothetical protein
MPRSSSTDHRPFIILIAISFLLPAAWGQGKGQGVAEDEGRIETADTLLRVRAGATAPRIISLASPHLPAWQSRSDEPLIDSVEVDGVTAPLHWRFKRSASRIYSRQVILVYENDSPHLRLFWDWQAKAAFGPIEHTIRITNLSDRQVWLPLQSSLQFDFNVNENRRLEQTFIDKGAGKPTEIGTHIVPVDVGYQWAGDSSTFALPEPGTADEIIPWFLLQQSSPNNSRSGWYAGIEFSGRVQLTLSRTSSQVTGRAGLNPEPGPFRTRLLPGETFETPTAFVGAARGSLDDAGNVLRRWVRACLGNSAAWRDPHYPLLVNNSWGGGTLVNEALAHRMIAAASDLGLEMFHLDAGWFRGVGDWYPNPQKFPHGLQPIAADAHRRGMRFGLWSDWTQAALDHNAGALNVNDPAVKDWLVSDLPPDWKPEEFKGQTIDLGVPAASRWAQRETERMVRDYRLDMLEHDGYLVAQGCNRKDHPHAPPVESATTIEKREGGFFVRGPNSTDVSYRAVRAYYGIHDTLRKNHPGLLLEVCNDGGRMVDFGSAAHGDYFSITDSYDPVSNRRAFFDASHLLPAAMLETYVQKWPAPTLETFRYVLRSGMMGWLSVMQDTSEWTQEQRSAAKEDLLVYKNILRPLIRDADLYHVSARPDGIRWDATEYFEPRTGHGVVYAFRGSIENESSHSFALLGLDKESSYQLHFNDGSSPDRIMRGSELMSQGLLVTLPAPESSEIILIERVVH